MNTIAAWRCALILGALVVLPGCSWLIGERGLVQDRKDEYRQAQAVEMPQVPPDLEGGRIQDSMPVPLVGGMDTYLAEAEFELPRPSTLFSREDERGVRIQRLGIERWIVAPFLPAQVWPRVEQFLADNGVRVAAEYPEAGIIETDWFEVSETQYRDIVRGVIADNSGSDGPPYSRMRIRVEQAVRQGSSEIHLLFEGATAAVNGPWPELSSTEAVELGLLNELAAYIASGVGATGVSLVAQEIASEAKAEIVRDPDNTPMLRLRLPRERAWATVGSALSNAEILIVETDEEALFFEIEFDEEDFDEGGNWITDLISFGDVVGRFQLRMVETDDGYEVRVYDSKADEQADPDTGEVVLTVVREYAS